MTRKRGRALGWAWGISVLVLGCRTSPLAEDDALHDRVAPPIARSSGTEGEGGARIPFLLPAESLPETFVLRQTVTVRWREEAGEAQEAAFDAVIQREGESLLLLGLGPMGRVGFTLSLEAGKVSFENRTGRDLPFAPARMLADVQRVYYPWLKEEAPVCEDCVRKGTRGGFEIEEQRAAGLITRRRFVSMTGAGAGPGNQGGAALRGGDAGIEVVYSGEPAFGGVPRDARLRHAGFGYEVELETLRIDWLD